MLKSILESVINQPDRYNNKLWTYRLSGNMLEIMARPKYNQDPDLYRMAVIRSGQVLQAFYQQARLKNQRTMIQSFPNMEETSLVAVIRLLKPDEGAKSKTSDYFKNEQEPEESHPSMNPQTLIAIASHYGMFLHPLCTDSSDLPKQELIFSELSIDLAGRSCFGLCSTSDNPFIWLKTGYWFERIRQLSESNGSLSMPSIHDEISKEKRSGMCFMFEDCPFVQALVLS
ncbi:MAG: hypothetical protein WD035_08870 [Balneolaceae bacterium]